MIDPTMQCNGRAKFSRVARPNLRLKLLFAIACIYFLLCIIIFSDTVYQYCCICLKIGTKIIGKPKFGAKVQK